MHDDRMNARRGEIAVIFVSRRNGDDPTDYAAAAATMDALAAVQPGYRGMESVRDADGLGITCSYWADDATAMAWRDHPDHKVTRDRGRGVWYESYQVIVARVERSYGWIRA